MQIGIRLHDVNSSLTPWDKTLEMRAKTAKEEGFTCAHVAIQKVMEDMPFGPDTLTEGLAFYLKRVFARYDLDMAVLGCYHNLAHPDPVKLQQIQSLYCEHMRMASLCGAGVVGTETGAPNEAYKLDAFTHTEAAFRTFERNLEIPLQAAESWGVTLAIEPVFNHIVYDPAHAARLISDMGSRHLRIILDPVNLLCADNAAQADDIMAQAIDLLGERISVIHIKDYHIVDGVLRSCPLGTGCMDYTRLMKYLKAHKPFIQATLEDTTNETAPNARKALEAMYAQA